MASFCRMLPIQTVGVMGDMRTYEMLSLRAVTSTDGMTADWYRFDHEFLEWYQTKLSALCGVLIVLFTISAQNHLQLSSGIE